MFEDRFVWFEIMQFANNLPRGVRDEVLKPTLCLDECNMSRFSLQLLQV